MKRLKKFLKLAIPVFGLSAFMDYLLWFTRGYMVPSWTIATMSLSYTVLLAALYRIL